MKHYLRPTFVTNVVRNCHRQIRVFVPDEILESTTYHQNKFGVDIDADKG